MDRCLLGLRLLDCLSKPKVASRCIDDASDFDSKARGSNAFNESAAIEKMKAVSASFYSLMSTFYQLAGDDRDLPVRRS